MNRQVLKAIFENGIEKLTNKGLKYVEVYHNDDSFDYVWMKGKALGAFKSFTQFNDYAFGGKKINDLSNYTFYSENGSQLTKHTYEKWQLIDISEIIKEYKKKLNGARDVLMVKDSIDGDWYFIFPDGKRVAEDDVWAEEE